MAPYPRVALACEAHLVVVAPAVSSSAQHFIAARGHLDAGIDALAGVTAGREEPEIKDTP